jgi:hypothetical protein
MEIFSSSHFANVCFRPIRLFLVHYKHETHLEEHERERQVKAKKKKYFLS